jgi:amino acid adenylation domain-containing protein/non-ribosomal peptide synthase protein (TIGR01720 family)
LPGLNANGGSLPGRIKSQTQTKPGKNRGKMNAKIKKPGNKNIEDILALTPMQEGMLFHYLKTPESDNYFEQLNLEISGVINLEFFEKAWNSVIETNEMLRTVFRWEKVENPIQIILKKHKFQPEYYDFLGMDADERTKRIEKVTDNDRKRSLDLREVPFRLILCKVKEDKYKMIISNHHILYDGWSNGIILRELLNAYNDLVMDKIPVKPAKNRFKSYVKWLYSQDLNVSKQYWEKYLAGFDVKTGLPYKKKYKSEKGEIDIDTAHYRYTLAEPLKNKVEEFAAKNRATTASVFYLIWGILLQKHNRCEDIVFGTTVSGRSVKVKGIEDMVGLFINTLPLRLKPHPHETIIESLEKVNKNIKDREKYDNMSLAAVKGCAALDKRHELFDSIIIIENYPLDIHMMNNKNGFSITSYSIIEKTNYDLTIGITLSGDVRISVSYNTHRFDEPSIIKIFNTFAAVLEEVIRCPGKEVSSLEIVSTEEKEQILHEFNNTGADYPAGVTIHRLFAEQAERTPDGAAVIGQSAEVAAQNEDLRPAPCAMRHTLTYRELNQSANRLAHLLRKKGVLADSIVGIMVERSVEMIIGILGILKAGGAYLPIDPGFPQQRKKYILKDAGVRWLISHAEYVRPFRDNCDVIDSALENFYTGASQNLAPGNSSVDLAYIIYTSGSTGNPKGVAIEHRPVVNLLIDLNRRYPFGAADNYLLKTSYLFDVSVTELFGWFIGGGRLTVLEKGGEKDPSIILREIEYRNVTHINFVPSMLHAFNDILAVENVTGLKYLRYIFLAGEALKPKLVGPLVKLHPHIQVENLYGPTEAAVYASQYSLSCWDGTGDIPIGKPVGNVKLVVLNRYNQLQGIGIPGELCIGGVGLARGYLNKPGLTQDRFVDNPFVPGERLYKTGDLANWLPDGNIEFLGRIDQQVKIRGFRIELEEIEKQLLIHKEVKEAVVIDRQNENENKYLCAYIVRVRKNSDEKSEKDANMELEQYLSQRLPGYMIPAYFVNLDKIPLNASGKVDRKALPGPAGGGETGYVPPGDDIEVKLAETWSGVLGVRKIGVTDSFFNLGGDSIKTIQIQARMNKLGYRLEVEDIFKYPTIAQLAKKVKKRQRIIRQSAVTGEFPLTPIQRALFEDDTDVHHFNQAVMLYSRQGLDPELVRKIFQKVQEHHDALRMTYNRRGAAIIQTNHDPDYPLWLEEHDLAAVSGPREELLEKTDGIQASITLEEGPMMKLGLFHLADGDRLLIVIHHLVIDGVSWRILFEDIETLYRQFLRGEKASLQSKSHSFKQWCEKLDEYSKRNVLLEEIDYWKAIDTASIRFIDRDFAGPHYVKDRETRSFRLSEETTDALLKRVNTAYNTEINDILLTGLGLAVQKSFGLDRVLITLEGHGRENISENIDISRTIGWFTAMYPVVLDMTYPGAISRQIKEVKETLRRVPDKGIGYGILKYLTPPEYKDQLKFRQQPQIEFNYLGQFDADINRMSTFEIAGESSGQPVSSNRKSPHDFSIEGIIAGSRLTMTVTYSKKQYKPETVETLIKNYQKTLNEVIAHCINKNERERSPSDFTYKKLSIPEIDALTREYEIEDIYTLSPMQEGMLFHSLEDVSSASYLEQVSYRLKGELDPLLVEKTLNELFKRHDILRTFFIYDKYERPLQIVLEDRRVDFIYKDIRGKGRDEKRVFTEEYKRRDKHHTFSLKDDVLMRFALIRVSEDEFEIVWAFHHILMDGWCIGIINMEFFEIYDSYLGNRAHRLAPVTPYRTYIQWLESRDKEASRDYWLQYLDSYGALAGIPGKTGQKGNDPGCHKRNYKNEDLLFVLDKGDIRHLHQLAAKNRVTPNTMIQVIWGVLLGKYNGSRDVVFAAVVSGRPPEIEGIETMVGLFINTIPVRIRYDENATFKNLLSAAQEAVIKSEPHHYYPLGKIQTEVALKRNLLDHLFAFENYPLTEQTQRLLDKKERNIGDLKVEISDIDVFEQSHYDLNVRILGTGDRLTLNFKYNANVYQKKLLEKVAHHFKEIVKQVVRDENIRLKDIALYYSRLDVETNIDNDDYVNFSFQKEQDEVIKYAGKTV